VNKTLSEPTVGMTYEWWLQIQVQVDIIDAALSSRKSKMEDPNVPRQSHLRMFL